MTHEKLIQAYRAEIARLAEACQDVSALRRAYTILSINAKEVFEA